MFSPDFIRTAAENTNSVILENTKPDSENAYGYIFLSPVEVIRADSPEMIQLGLQRLEKAVSDGYYAAGFVSYEAGKVFEKSLPSGSHSEGPYLWFGVYDKPIVFDYRRNRFTSGRIKSALRDNGFIEACQLSNVVPTLFESEYIASVNRVREYIREGDTYQVNYTFKLNFDYSGSVTDLYCILRNSQHVPYSAFVHTENSTILSFSPELFFRIEGNSISLRPMKGTIARGRNLEEDARNVELLKKSEKNRAENLMIVDLLRNDVGRIAKTGTVRVSSFFDIEKYDTVFQATSTIRAKLQPNWSASEVVRSLFPSGSVTGAPKIRTMQIIQELEREPRGVYTGAIGFFSPKRKAVFSVAIRTLVLNERRKTGEMGVGSGFVHDSVPEDEYRECLLKAKFLTEPAEDFLLFETVRWDALKGWPLLGHHLKRLKQSAQYFDFKYSAAAIHKVLAKYERKFRKSSGFSANRMKITLARSGDLNMSVSPLAPLTGVQLTAISELSTDSNDRFLFHKTSNRKVYDNAIRRAENLSLFDFIFLNKNGEVTEGARSNVIIRKANEYYTPPLSCGILPGVYRMSLLKRKKMNLREKLLTVRDLKEADELYLCNALRGLIKAQLVDIHHQETENNHAELLAAED